MVFKEVLDDLFNRSLYHEGVHYVQCASADLRLGRGIAQQFNDHFDIKKKLMEHYGNYILVYDNHCVYLHGIGPIYSDVLSVPGTPVYTLITKRNYWDKPTNDSMYHALYLLRQKAYHVDGVTEFLMPKIGCGLDKLKWKDVKEMIFKIFGDTDASITVCRLREVVK